jgi:hypothetical protein
LGQSSSRALAIRFSGWKGHKPLIFQRKCRNGITSLYQAFPPISSRFRIAVYNNEEGSIVLRQYEAVEHSLVIIRREHAKQIAKAIVHHADLSRPLCRSVSVVS